MKRTMFDNGKIDIVNSSHNLNGINGNHFEFYNITQTGLIALGSKTT